MKKKHPYYLNVEQAARVYVDPGGLLEVLGELVLVVLLDLHHLQRHWSVRGHVTTWRPLIGQYEVT